MKPDEQRLQMVARQIEARGVRDPRVLAAMRKVPRHMFVPQASLPAAYEDRPLPIGQGQTISQPYMVATMTEALELRGDERVLEIGTGSGYQTAILAELAGEVISIERIGSLAEEAALRLAELGYNNVRVRTADGSLGWPALTPYAGIMVTAGAPRAPQALLDQLATGARMVIPVGGCNTQILETHLRIGPGKYNITRDTACRFVDLIGEQGW
ncbi:MAG TPA: protein-L-isoaspartate(D-aspartate) O-methyltransferase [Myxococcota bacterium]|nr:protein-L-isoaspartate(D-aspartate) O-methyltransferase [Myxococcota bacterium]